MIAPRVLDPRLIVLLTLTMLLATACQAEQRPGPGSVQRIGPTPSGGSSGSVSGSVSGVIPPTGAFATPTSVAAPATSSNAPTPGDGVYTPVSNVDQYLYFAVDFQEISALTNAVNEGRPMPSSDILAIYERGKNPQPTGTRGLREFARGEARATEFPEAAEFYRAPTFLDDPVIQAAVGAGAAGRQTPAQRRQVIQKGVQRILYYHTLQELRAAIPKIEAGNVEPVAGAPHNVDEAWAIYVGLPEGTSYARSLSGTAKSREMNFNREGTINRPAREALQRAQQAAAAGNLAAFRTAQSEVEGRLHAIFYLGAARYLNEALKAAQLGNTPNAAVAQAEGLTYYMSIQPLVAKADAAANQAVVAYYQADPATLTMAMRDETLAALNRTISALGLAERDRVAPSDLQ